MPDRPVSRRRVLERGAKLSFSLVVFGTAAGRATAETDAGALPDADLAYARLLVGAELLTLDFYTQALAAKQFGREATKTMKRVFFNEQEHYAAVSQMLAGAGQTAAKPEDFDFTYPAETFRSKRTIVKLAVELETVSLGAYLGAVDALQTDALKAPVARIAASEAQHLGAFARLAGEEAIGNSFPSTLTIDQASAALDAYTS